MVSRLFEFSTSAREKQLAGIDILADAVSVTLGPQGRTVILEKNFGMNSVTKDGVSVAKHIFLKDPFENLGAQILKQAATKTAQVAGDGTTTSTVLARRLARTGFEAMKKGANPVQLKKGMEIALVNVLEHIKATSKPITTPQEIVQIATISANGEKQIGELIGAAIAQVSKEGSLSVETSDLEESALEYKEGMGFEQGYISPYFITDERKQTAELSDCCVLIYDGVMSNLQAMLPFIDLYHDTTSKDTHGIGRNLLIIAQDVKNEPLDAFLANCLNGKLKSCAVKAPFRGALQKSVLNDIALVTGATIISDNSGITWQNATLDMLGVAEKVTIKNTSTTIIGGQGNPELIEKRCEELLAQIRDSLDEMEKVSLRARLSKLKNGIAIIKAGGTTSVEMEERRDRIEDAIFATKAALEDGISAGGGTALARVPRVGLDKLEGDILKGAKLLYAALTSPFETIVSNAGLDVEKITEEFYSDHGANPNFGFDAANAKHVDMIKAGIIDPTKVIVTALQNAVSVAGILLTTECMITYDPEDVRKDG